MKTHLVALLPIAIAACLYDGKGTAGLPCNVDADCSAYYCIEGICGGPDAAATEGATEAATEATTGDGGTSATEADDAPTPQMLPEPCVDGATQCLGDNAMSECVDGKLHRDWCEGVCGEGNPPLGGCQPDPRDGHEQCWCTSDGGPPSATCGTPCAGDGDCNPGEFCADLLSTGWTCIAAGCADCFADLLSCYSHPDSCSFGGCA